MSGRGEEGENGGCAICVTPWDVGDSLLSGDLKVRQYVCSGVSEDGRAVSLTCAIGCTSAAMFHRGCDHDGYRDMACSVLWRLTQAFELFLMSWNISTFPYKSGPPPAVES